MFHRGGEAGEVREAHGEVHEIDEIAARDPANLLEKPDQVLCG